MSASQETARERSIRARERRARRKRARREAYERWEREYVAALEADYRRALARDEIARRLANPAATVAPSTVEIAPPATVDAPLSERPCRPERGCMRRGSGNRPCRVACFKAGVTTMRQQSVQPPAAPAPAPARVRNLGRR